MLDETAAGGHTIAFLMLLFASAASANPFKSFLTNLGNTFNNYNENMAETGAV